jgi:RAD54-like protein 2
MSFLQVVSFVDVFLGNTEAKKVLCIVPINTIQNWLAEFNYWLPAKVRPAGFLKRLISNF